MKLSWIILALFFLNIVHPQQVAAKTVTLNAVKDCEVKAPFPDTAFASDPNLQSLKTAVLANNSILFWQFDLPVDCNANAITSVTWKNVLVQPATGSNAAYFCIIRETAEDTISNLNTLTWNTAPGINRTSAPVSGTVQYDPTTSLFCGYQSYPTIVGTEWVYNVNSTTGGPYWENLKDMLDEDSNSKLTFFLHERYIRDAAGQFASIENGIYHGPQLEISYPSNGDGLTINLEESDASTLVYEEGATFDTYTIVLGGVPEYDVQITINPDGLTNVQPSQITFNQFNWNVPQTVTVTAIDDTLDQSPNLYDSVISHVVTSQDTYYAAISIPAVTVEVYDNEGPCDISEYLPEDIVQDCYINQDDLFSLAEKWLMSTDPATPAPPLTVPALSEASTGAPEWTGQGTYRFVVRVDPVALTGSRSSDQLVARYEVDFDALMAEFNASGVVDLSTLQVHKIDPNSGLAQPYSQPFENSVSVYDRPCRFEDNLAPYDYAQRSGNASSYPDGLAPQEFLNGAGRLFNRTMDYHAGRILWTHDQIGSEPSYYAIYWDTKETTAQTGPSPAPWIGDADVLRKQDDQGLAPHNHLRQTIGDLNGDGLFDIVLGEQKGNVLFLPNEGTLGNPRFLGCRPLLDEYGPIDGGWYAAPYLYDWNGDGLLDLLLGTGNNAILWWKNIGTAAAHDFQYQGPVQADGENIDPPDTPCEADPDQSIWPYDYFTIPCVCDWNSDGLPDIITGSYLTGQISYYRCTGRDSNDVPTLTFEGVLEADGQVLDTVWAAAPLVYDFNNDGKQDLITGSWNYGNYGTNIEMLMYYKNVGTPEVPVLQRQNFPSSGSLPNAIIAHPSVVDWNNDGLMDLFVGIYGGYLYEPFLNVGTSISPLWETTTSRLTTQWGIWSWVVNAWSVIDWDGDGNKEMLRSTTVSRLSGSPHSPTKTAIGTCRTPDGSLIYHEGPGYGDHYNWNIFADWDEDGLTDILCGTQQGNVYFHKNLGDSSNLIFDYGIKFKLYNGNDVKVGPPVYANPDDVPDFTALQGARTKPLVDDVDGDGFLDLIITETYGQIWVFTTALPGETDQFLPGVIMGTGVSRFPVTLYDWNKDGKKDIISALPVSNPGTVYINQSSIGTPDFSAGTKPFDLPYLFYNAVLHSTDWNNDGDDDFLAEGEYYGYWIEGSFIEHGYIDGQRIQGVMITETDDSTDVNEEGSTSDTYYTNLRTEPTDTTIVTITPDEQVTVNPSQLVFNTSNWQTPQPVTVRAVDDSIYESTLPDKHQSLIIHTMTGQNEESLVETPLTVNITDNDRICGDPETVYNLQDINRDCYVNIEDMAMLAKRWLFCYDPRFPDSCD